MLKTLPVVTVQEEFKDKEWGVHMSCAYIIAQRMKELRIKRGLTQSQIAEELEVSRSTVASWENGVCEPNGVELGELSEFFCVSADYLYGRVDECTMINIPKVYRVDLNRLNALGKQTLFEFYNFLAQNEIYRK